MSSINIKEPIAEVITGQLVDVCQQLKKTLYEYENTTDYDDKQSLNIQLAMLYGKFEVLSSIASHLDGQALDDIIKEGYRSSDRWLLEELY